MIAIAGGKEYIMITEKHSGQENPVMLIPKTVLFSTLKEAISTGSDEKIRDLSDILYSPFEMNMITASRVDTQHGEILQVIESMKEGFRQIDKRFELVEKRFEEVDKRFEAVDKRFDDLIHQMDKRFEGIDRRFEDMSRRFTFQSWLIGIGFITINSLVVILKLFG